MLIQCARECVAKIVYMMVFLPKKGHMREGLDINEGTVSDRVSCVQEAAVPQLTNEAKKYQHCE